MIPVPKFNSKKELEDALRAGVARGGTFVTVEGVTPNGYQKDRPCDVCGEPPEDHNGCRWRACNSDSR